MIVNYFNTTQLRGKIFSLQHLQSIHIIFIMLKTHQTYLTALFVLIKSGFHLSYKNIEQRYL